MFWGYLSVGTKIEVRRQVGRHKRQKNESCHHENRDPHQEHWWRRQWRQHQRQGQQHHCKQGHHHAWLQPKDEGYTNRNVLHLHALGEGGRGRIEAVDGGWREVNVGEDQSLGGVFERDLCVDGTVVERGIYGIKGERAGRYGCCNMSSLIL